MFFFPSFSTAEDAFLSAIINYTNSSTVHFKLSPTYVLYMTCRYVLSSQYRPDITPTERTHKVIAIVNKMVNMMEGVIQVSFSAKTCQGNEIYLIDYLVTCLVVFLLFNQLLGVRLIPAYEGLLLCQWIMWVVRNSPLSHMGG